MELVAPTLPPAAPESSSLPDVACGGGGDAASPPPPPDARDNSSGMGVSVATLGGNGGRGGRGGGEADLAGGGFAPGDSLDALRRGSPTFFRSPTPRRAFDSAESVAVNATAASSFVVARGTGGDCTSFAADRILPRLSRKNLPAAFGGGFWPLSPLSPAVRSGRRGGGAGSGGMGAG